MIPASLLLSITRSSRDVRLGGEKNLNVIVDLDIGDHRTGIQPGKPALDLAKLIANSRHLRFAGLQGYSVRASHAESANRAQVSAESLNAVEETRALLESAGIPVPLTTGASTATALLTLKPQHSMSCRQVLMSLWIWRTGALEGFPLPTLPSSWLQLSAEIIRIA